MFLIIFMIFHLTRQGTQAFPVPEVYQSFPSSRSDPHHYRTTWNIVGSCLTTIFSCTWLAIHPNIPGPSETRLEIVLHHIWVMLLTLIAPEFVVAWAMRQRLVADDLVRTCHPKGQKWTRTHGFFAIMGGFFVIDAHGRHATIYPRTFCLPSDITDDHEYLNNYVGSGEINVSEAEIRDKSKSDIFSKAFVLLQTGWFVLQFVTRGIQHLPITGLETATFAFATLSFVIYGLWWDKPHRVRCPILVSSAGSRPRQSEYGICDQFKMMWEKTSQSIRCMLWGLELRGIWFGSRPPYEALLGRNKVIRVILFPFTICYYLILSPIVKLAGASSDKDNEHDKVGMFYSGRLPLENYHMVNFVVTATATGFGAIHCIAWSFHFPSPIEQTMWRISSVAITFLPALCGFNILLLIQSFRGFLREPVIFGTLYFVYGLARVTLLALALGSLRSLHPDSHRTVYWIEFIPHL